MNTFRFVLMMTAMLLAPVFSSWEGSSNSFGAFVKELGSAAVAQEGEVTEDGDEGHNPDGEGGFADGEEHFDGEEKIYSQAEMDQALEDMVPEADVQMAVDQALAGMVPDTDVQMAVDQALEGMVPQEEVDSAVHAVLDAIQQAIEDHKTSTGP